MKKRNIEQESEINRINREEKEWFDQAMDEYIESPEFVMYECAKGVGMAVAAIVDLIKPTLKNADPRYADEVKTYLNWVKNTEHEADTLSRLAKMDPAQARTTLDLWDAGLTSEPTEYTRLETEIEAAGRDPAWKEFDDLRWKLHHAVSIFLREVRLYLDGKPPTDYARIAAEQAAAANAKIPTPRPQAREDIIRLVQEIYTSDELKNAIFPGHKSRRKPSLPRAAQYVHTVATDGSAYYERIVSARMLAKTLYKKTRDGETQFWSSIAQAAKSSHGRKVYDELAPVAIPTGW